MTIDYDLYLEHLGLAGSLAISLFVLLGLALRLYETPDRRMFLWAMVAFFTINSLDMLDSLLYGPVLIGPDALYQWQDVLIPGFILSLYFYVRGLTSSNPTLSRRDLLHLLPFVIAFLCLAPRLLQPGAIRRTMSTSDLSPAYKQLAELGENTFWAMWVVFLIFYGGLSVHRLYRHKRNIRTLFSDLEGKTLRWLDALVATIFLLAFIVIVDEIGLLMGRPEIRAGWVSAAFDLILAGSFGIFALRAVPPLPQWSAEVLPEAPPAPQETPQPDTENRRYARSGLQPEDLDRYAQRLEQRVAQNQLWRDHDINLRRLAAEIAVPSIHLSEVLNTRLGMSFYDYINQCRISDACALLIETEMTILEISETVGFNAKSTFNTSFKKITGQTPSQWRRTHQP
ncbi:helix-turn-helix transcriptional regulator [Shimia sp. CNT1-13L.2]|uniref:helix-turn-helix domain-containing protein n=1 Tax=Shimia sp. CNT1-13L.2 TaxID=2959663 RepID=UPI0020CC9EB3|nr:helix-turn-helix transcriptional regulator [Shimia sp. CNT1-13L.2]MCP9481231.1 helix-turn-helix transcriptional regulator [Shimia sp. CNT1-13L.2]